jgi:AcrR family transcriptional regulator
MRESKARKRILQTADEMFSSVGYAGLNVNKIAHEAGVSIGTLYYHFPEGKLSLLMEVRRQRAEQYETSFKERFDSERLRETETLDEGLELLLRGLIEIHREQRLVLAAMDSEVLSNLASYDRVAESVAVGELMESDARAVTGVLQALLERHPGEGLSLDSRGARLSKVMDVLIHRFVYVEQMFGSESEFIDMMIRIIRALLE